jgi:transcriptional regulator with XRE-family HTH domain
MESDIKYQYGMSDPAILNMLGDFIRKTRLNQNRTQQEVSAAAGINRSTLVQMEKGSGGNMLSLIQILRVLEQLHLLYAFEIKQEISPLQLAEMEIKMRKRARRKQPTEDKPKSDW